MLRHRRDAALLTMLLTNRLFDVSDASHLTASPFITVEFNLRWHCSYTRIGQTPS
jgi:hypothetical protein